MNRWYFPFVVGIIIFMFLFLLGDYEMTLILTLSGGFTLGFFLIYWFNRGSHKGEGRR
jgi:hypothetical protein